MLQRSIWSSATLLVLAVAAMGQIGSVKVYACDLTDLGSCLSGTTNPGQQDAVYDSTHGLAYHPMAACCHSDDYNQQFAQGYNAEWNQYQSQSANVNVENSPGAVVSVNQKSNQDQISRCGNHCPCSGSCDSGSSCSSDSCGVWSCDSGYGFHHFGFHHEGGFVYRHIGLDP